MTFTFKLSRRLARLKAIPLLALLFTISCEAGDANGPASADPINAASDGSTRFPAGMTADESLSATKGRPRKRRNAITQVSVSPTATTLRPGGTQAYSAVAMRSDGAPVDTEMVWTATGGAIDAVGQYTAGQTLGSFVVVATASGISDTATVTIAATDSPASQVVLTPTSASLPVGGTLDFDAIGETSSGTPVAITPIYTASAGTISSTGKYTAPKAPGRYRVAASDPVSGRADSASVTVTDTTPVLSRVVVSPTSASVVVGGTKQFSAEGLASDGSAVPIDPTYSATGGTISSSGLYTAGQAAGTYRVIGAASGKADTATVTVEAAPDPAPPPPPPPAAVLAQVVLSPTTASLAVGEAKQFTAAGKAADGTAVVMNPIYAATGGAISSSGMYTAGSTAGAFRVIARDSATGKADTAAVTIAAPTPTLQSVVVTPATVSLASAATQQFAATGKMSDGSTSPVTVSWTAGGGTISSSGFYNAGQTAGNYRVVASVAGGKADTAAVTITAPTAPPPPQTGGCDTDKSSLMFYGNFESGAPPYPRVVNQSTTWDGFEISQVGTQSWSLNTSTSPKHECATAARIELRRSDPAIAGSNRAQIMVGQTGFGNGGVSVPGGKTIGGGAGDERWMGFSVYIPADWTFETGYAPETIWEVLDGTRTPPLEININGSQWQIQNQTGHGSQGDPSWVAQNTYAPVERGVWTDWVVHYVLSGSNGILQVWKNGTLLVNKSGTWTSYTDTGTYTKPVWGIYKWSWNGSTSGGASIVSSRSLLIDNVRVTDGSHGGYSTVAPR